MTKLELSKSVSKKTGVDEKTSMAIIESFIETVKESLEMGENVYIRGFGSFINKKKARKVARIITKNESIVIDEHFAPKFKPSKIFIEKIKNSKNL